ncbi:MAG: YkgJ family cysteine cluster protein, partial [Cytophagia bacterium]|nr:YkgJ family cysteine cluster protein [Cytophagia bacterium]
MRLDEKVKAVAEVFTKLDAEIAAFQQNTKLHCKMGCGKCCFKPDIEATPLEFLPFAFDLYQKDQAFEWF